MVEPPMISHWCSSDPFEYVKTTRENKLFFINDVQYGDIVVKYPIRDFENLVQELQVYKKLLTVDKSPNICYPLFVNNTTDNKALVFPYVGRTLLVMWRKMSRQELLNVFIDIVSALETIHSAEIIYFDLHELNILIDENGRGILIDFNTSEFFDEERLSLSPNQNFDRYPLEAWTTYYDHTLDIYCFGYLLKNYLPELKFIARKCMNSDPKKRPNLVSIKNQLLNVEIF